MINLTYSKFQKKPIKGTKVLSKSLRRGKFGLYILESGELTLNQLDFLKKKLSMLFKTSKYWSLLPVAVPKTSKILGARMGSGKGETYAYIYKIVKGCVLLEWNKPLSVLDLTIFRSLPIKVCVIKRSL